MRIALTWLALAILSGPRLLGQQSSSETVARNFIRAQEASMQGDATAASIEATTRWLTDSVVYEHPRAGARLVGRATVAHAMAGFLGATRHARIIIRRLIQGAGVIVVEEDVRFDALHDGRWGPARRIQVTVLDFQGGQISHVVDFWRPG